MWFQFSDRQAPENTASLRCVNFLERADYGSISLDDKTIDLKTATKEQASEIQRKTGFVFQNYNLFRNKTALENITLGLTSGRGMSRADAVKKGMMLLRKYRSGRQSQFLSERTFRRSAAAGCNCSGSRHGPGNYLF